MKLIKKIYNSFYSRSTILAFLLLVIITSILFQDKNFLTTANVFNILLKAAKNGGFLALGMTLSFCVRRLICRLAPCLP